MLTYVGVNIRVDGMHGDLMEILNDEAAICHRISLHVIRRGLCEHAVNDLDGMAILLTDIGVQPCQITRPTHVVDMKDL